MKGFYKCTACGEEHKNWVKYCRACDNERTVLYVKNPTKDFIDGFSDSVRLHYLSNKGVYISLPITIIP